MAYLKNIINKLQTHYNITLNGTANESVSIESVFLFYPNGALPTVQETSQLYIGTEQEWLQTESFDLSLDYVLLLNCHHTTAASHILTTPEDLPLRDVFRVIQEEMLRFHLIQLKKEELFFALHKNKGLQDILQISYSFLKNPISVCDTSFAIVDCCPPLEDERNLEYRNGKLYLKSAFFKNMIDNHITDKIYHSSSPFLTQVEDFPFDWCFTGIRINHAIVGYICVRGVEHPFSEDDLDFIHLLSHVLSIAMQKDNIYQNPTGLKYEYFLGDLLSGQFDSLEFIEKRLTQLGHSLTPYYHVITLRFLDPTGKHPSPKYYYDQVTNIFPKCMIVFFRGMLTILMPSKTSVWANELQMSRMHAFLEFNQIRAAVSFPFSNILKTPEYYNQTLSLLELPTISTTEESTKLLFSYEDYYLDHVFALCSEKTLLRNTIHPGLLEISRYDEENHTDYVNTLRTYLNCNRNAVLAANELHIHKSTFFYRLSKISELFGFDPNDGTMLFAYDYSFRLMKYLEMKS